MSMFLAVSLNKMDLLFSKHESLQLFTSSTCSSHYSIKLRQIPPTAYNKGIPASIEIKK